MIAAGNNLKIGFFRSPFPISSYSYSANLEKEKFFCDTQLQLLSDNIYIK